MKVSEGFSSGYNAGNKMKGGIPIWLSISMCTVCYMHSISNSTLNRGSFFTKYNRTTLWFTFDTRLLRNVITIFRSTFLQIHGSNGAIMEHSFRSVLLQLLQY